MIAAGAIVTADVPAYGLIVGVPGRLRGWVCRCGWPLTEPAMTAPPECPRCGPRPDLPVRNAPDPRLDDVIAVNPPAIGREEEALVLEVLRSGRLVKGPMVERFERAVREVVGTQHAIAVNSGTSALVAALLAHGIRPGDEVITSPFTFVATLNAILHAGAHPRFVDIGDDFDLDPDGIDAVIGPATKALLPVHLYGLPADVPRAARPRR